MGIRARRSWPLALAASGALLLSGCAQFDDSAGGQSWEPAPELTPEVGPQPDLPEADSRRLPSEPPTSQTPIPPPDGCKDFDKAVIATCLDTVSAVAALPTDGSTVNAYAAERKSGRVFLVGNGTKKSEVTTLPVTAAGDGGLTGLALSPTFTEDRLLYAYLTTPTDNRVVRFAEGQQPKPVLTGIPKGTTGNRGAILADGKGALLVATGDAGNPAAAADPKSLAGKVLRITPAGKPAEGNPKPDSPVIASGLHSPGGLCKTTDGARLWVTDRGGAKDALYRIEPGKTLDVPAWTWPDKPGVTGCADWTDMVAVATSGAGNIQNLPLTEEGSVGGKPQVTMDGANGTSYGKLSSLDPVTPDVAVAGTVNKDGGQPVSSDDRVVLIVRQPASGSGRD
ncbi:PQQ-dependent sugar dehydrogenase [Prauserella muralis]|uniref:Glucose dehydrogenase n=1 Tax=Prauserella muralis TaxID=588067 RepID=A0A2V4AYI2_9PSEU|nr:PQQ-dependent sugar dehydrogenase [Prauserella muralis]PXY27030.1 glucose dehydrogenase [Prauserella muralis]TWE23347.1 glucose/sorbosone dehydrogenase [Prauserella muralis]